MNADSDLTTSQLWLQRLKPLLPLLASAACLPYVLVYFANLWQLAHYQFFPLLVAVVAYLAYTRWGEPFDGNWVFKLLNFICLSAGVFGALCATVFASPWMGYFGFAACIAVWFAGRKDSETGQSLFYLAIPLALIWQPPYNTIVTGDSVLIQKLQSLSARLSSQWLDMLGYSHFQPGTVLEFAGKSFGVAEACSGIQSFFAVLCFGALIAAYFRRGVLHTVVLLGTSPLWAVLMNTTRITAIPIAYSATGVDLSHGILHDLLGYCTMALALALLVSTDECLLSLSNRISLDANWTLVGRRNANEYSRHKPIQVIALIPCLLVMGGIAFLQITDVRQSWNSQRKVIDFFRDEPLLNMAYGDAPAELKGWKQRDYVMENRERDNDDLGQRSDLWYYQAPFGEVTLSFDQMFPGWHELTRCYRASGWKLQSRKVLASEFSGGWPIVIAEFTREGEHGYLLWSLVTRDGKQLNPPGQWNTWTSLKERLQNRLTPTVRGALFGIAVYQLQAFSTSVGPLTTEQRQDVLERFKPARDAIWIRAQERIAETFQ